MRIKTIILTFALSVSPLTVLAGGGHDHGHSHSHGTVQVAAEVSQSQAERVANLRVSMLVNKGKIDKIWKSVKATSAKKKMNGHQAEWVVKYNTDQVTDTSKSTLYVFISSTGDYIAANFTGK